jgi:hypothetical protein
MKYLVRHGFLKHKPGDLLDKDPGRHWRDRNFVMAVDMEETVKLESKTEPEVKPNRDRVRTFRERNPVPEQTD